MSYHPAAVVVARFLLLLRGDPGDWELGDLLIPDLAPVVHRQIWAGKLDDIADNSTPVISVVLEDEDGCLIVEVRNNLFEEIAKRVGSATVPNVRRIEVRELPDLGWRISAIGEPTDMPPLPRPGNRAEHHIAAGRPGRQRK